MAYDFYIPLRISSHYSFGKSSIKIPNLVNFASSKNIPALCLADYGNMFGAMEFALNCASNGIQPITACIINVSIPLNDDNTAAHQPDHALQFASNSPNAPKSHIFDHNKNVCEVVLIAQTKAGYVNLIKLVSAYNLTTQESPTPYIQLEQLLSHLDGLIVLLNPKSGFLRTLFDRKHEINNLLSKFTNSRIKGNFFIELTRNGNLNLDESEFEKRIIEISYQSEIPIVATSTVSFLREEDHEACDALLCIVENSYIFQEDRNKISKSHYLKNFREMKKIFSDIPEALDNTVLITKKCSFFLDKSPPIFPKFSNNPEEESDLLREKARIGLEKRIKGLEDSELKRIYNDRLEYELDVIVQMKFHSYFLIVSDLIVWSKENGIVVGPGRGSAAGCLVAWSLFITDVDPVKFGLIFERFLNPGRVSLPDLDIDFCKLRRDEVIEYVRNRYGDNKVAHIITFGTLQARAALRDVGRVLQLPYNMINKICQFIPNNPANPINLSEAIQMDPSLEEMRKTDRDMDKLLKISLELEGCIKHSSKHAAGIVISAEALEEIIPLCKDDSLIPIVQYSMKYAEAAGLIKFDILGLKTLTVISETCSLISKYVGIDIDVKSLPLDDRKTYDMFSSGCNVGIFQFERSGIKDIIKNLRPDCIEDIIALGSLNRPGPMENIPLYIKRKHKLESVAYIHPVLEPILRETYGIIVYQEQVLEIARVFANYTLIEAESLRRSIGKKDKNEMSLQRDSFINKAVDNNYDKELAVTIFDLISKFASYGFNKSHAAAYAVISYYTAYLKAHYLIEFFIASINLEIDNSSKVGILCNEAKLLHIRILPPCINRSFPMFTIEFVDGVKCIRFGLGGIKNVGVKASEDIVSEREKNGDFKTINDFLNRSINSGLNKKILESFAKANVFHEIYDNGAKIFKNAGDILKQVEQANNGLYKDTKQGLLFSMSGVDAKKDVIDVANPNQTNDALDIYLIEQSDQWTEKEKLQAEYDAIGFYLTSHPLKQYSKELSFYGILSSNYLLSNMATIKKSARIAGVIVSINVRSIAGKNAKYAFVTLSDIDGMMETCIFDEDLISSKKDMLVEGRVVFCSISIGYNSTRIVIDEVFDIEEILSYNEVDIYINDYDGIKKVKNAIMMSNNSGIDVRLVVKGQKNVYLSLKNGATFKIQKNLILEMADCKDLEIRVVR